MVETEDLKIGVYICHCGTNISGNINIDLLKEYSSKISNVVLVKDYKFMCSDIGQKLIKADIESGIINRVVIAACSPRLHEYTFRSVCEDIGFNPFLFEQANIREHSSWVNLNDPKGAFEIARDHINMAVAKASKLKPLKKIKVSVEPSCLVIGGGIAGINSALDLANNGYKVYLLEKTPSIGGHMAQLDKTFPTMDCSACILTPRMVDIARNQNITLLTYSEIEGIDGYVGNFKIKIMKKPHYVDQIKCNGCGSCITPCPVICKNEFDLGMTSRKAIYIPFPQAIPGEYTIDMENCIKCGICADPNVCETEAINFNDKPEIINIKVGTIIVATGWDLYDPTELKQYGYGRYPNVINSLQMERLLSSIGPLSGNPARPSDLLIPKRIAFLQCVGSRYYREGGNRYCSRVCCMYAIKQARQYKEKYPDCEIFIFYIDMRTFGKEYEEFYESSQREYGIRYIRGRIAEVLEDKNNNIIIRSEDTLSQQLIELKVDLLILSCGLEPNLDSDKIGSLLCLQKSSDGFFMEAHPKLKPIDTLLEGIFIAGVAQGPKDIPDTVVQAKAAASGASILMAKGELEIDPYYTVIIEQLCSGCKICQSLCPYNAIEFDNYKKKAIINPILCKGCGTCTPACPSGAIEQNHFTSDQMNSIINIIKEDN